MKTKSIIIDVVFTWVDGKDEKYRDKLLNYIPKEKSKNNEVVFEWDNKFMVYLFNEVGEYNISLTLEDTNENTKTIIKNGLINVVK